MNTSQIVLAIDAEIVQLQKVRALLTGTDTRVKRNPARPAGGTSAKNAISSKLVEFSGKRPHMSAEGRAKIAAAQRARWAKSKKAAKKAAHQAASTSAKKAVTAKPVARKSTQMKKISTVKKPKRLKAQTAATSAS